MPATTTEKSTAHNRKLAVDMSFFAVTDPSEGPVTEEGGDVHPRPPVSDGALGSGGGGAAVTSAGPRIAILSSEGATFGPA